MVLTINDHTCIHYNSNITHINQPYIGSAGCMALRPPRTVHCCSKLFIPAADGGMQWPNM